MIKKFCSEYNLDYMECSAKTSENINFIFINLIQKIDSILHELQTWEKDIIFPLASQRIEINLDDGVKENYLKFGNALKKI